MPPALTVKVPEPNAPYSLAAVVPRPPIDGETD